MAFFNLILVIFLLYVLPDLHDYEDYCATRTLELAAEFRIDDNKKKCVTIQADRFGSRLLSERNRRRRLVKQL